MKLFARDSYLDLSTTPKIMGILNVTPDSFSDGGKYYLLDSALKHVNNMIKLGADIIDIGGESTKPGANNVCTEEELERVIPIIEAVAKRFNIWISVNTSKTKVMHESIKAGVHIINDIRALSYPGAIEIAADSKLPVCLMHMQGKPINMQIQPRYNNIITEINDYFIKQINRYQSAGISLNNIILDPGFGFGKNINHNYQLLYNLHKFHYFNLPLLVGMSRKSMIYQLLNVLPSQSLIGSLTCAIIAAMQNVQIIRVHDIKETVNAMHIIKLMMMVKEY
ncbi:MAG: dihydropteroate synthase [Pantoea sp. Brub]|nr:dihydropteroate synthase [Pantoea sp. Brub]